MARLLSHQTSLSFSGFLHDFKISSEIQYSNNIEFQLGVYRSQQKLSIQFYRVLKMEGPFSAWPPAYGLYYLNVCLKGLLRFRPSLSCAQVLCGPKPFSTFLTISLLSDIHLLALVKRRRQGFEKVYLCLTFFLNCFTFQPYSFLSRHKKKLHYSL